MKQSMNERKRTVCNGERSVGIMIRAPEYRAVLAFDIADSAGRGDIPLKRIRDVLFAAVQEALQRSGIGLEQCRQQDTGDGVRLIMPGEAWKAQLVHPFGDALAALLRAHNLTADPSTQIKVRAAMHAGDIHFDPGGEVVGQPLEVVSRLLDAPPVREELAANDSKSAPLSVILSQHFYDETVPHGYPGIVREGFHQVAVSVKKYTAPAWIWTPPESEPNPRGDNSSVQANGQPALHVGGDLSGAVVIGNGSSAHVQQAPQWPR